MKKFLLFAMMSVTMVACSMGTVKTSSEKAVQSIDMQRVSQGEVGSKHSI
ncbi:MAG: hypothetical protein ACRC0G_00155 [Fusobacteriaceae bacterium]